MNDLTPDLPDNIIAINPASAAELEITLREVESYKQCPGIHKSVETDSETRSLKCRHCGFVVDPFDYVLAWAREGKRRMTGLQDIEHKRKIAFAECEDLERKIKNMRAQLKRAGKPQPPEEKRAFDMRRWNPQLEGTKHQAITP